MPRTKPKKQQPKCHLKTALVRHAATPLGHQPDFFSDKLISIFAETRIGHDLKRARLDCHLSTAACARACGLTAAEWDDLERGALLLNHDADVERIHQALQIERERILTAGLV